MVGVGVLVVDADRYLLIRRAADPDKGLWAIPGGLVKIGEKVKQAAVREVREETGLEVELDRILAVIDKIVRDELAKIRYHFVIVDYGAHVVGGSLGASSDALEARWVVKDELGNYELTDSFRDLLRRLGMVEDLKKRVNHKGDTYTTHVCV